MGTEFDEWMIYFSKKRQKKGGSDFAVNVLLLLFMDLKAAHEGYDNNYDSQIYYRL